MQNHMSKTTHALRSMTAPYAESCSVPAQTNVGLSRTNKAVSAMNASYSEESHQTQHGNHVLTVTNMTPIYNNEEIRVIPVRKSLTRPQLICGCDRVLFLLLMLFCMALIFPGGLGSGNYVNVLIGIAFFFFGVQVLTVLAKYDPLFSQIFTRAVKYQDYYVGSSYVSKQDKSYS